MGIVHDKMGKGQASNRGETKYKIIKQQTGEMVQVLPRLRTVRDEQEQG